MKTNKLSKVYTLAELIKRLTKNCSNCLSRKNYNKLVEANIKLTDELHLLKLKYEKNVRIAKSR